MAPHVGSTPAHREALEPDNSPPIATRTAETRRTPIEDPREPYPNRGTVLPRLCSPGAVGQSPQVGGGFSVAGMVEFREGAVGRDQGGAGFLVAAEVVQGDAEVEAGR